MIRPTYEYDHGRVTLTFAARGDFEATRAAETWLKSRGFSVGPMQGDNPRGVFLGSVIIGKWRTILPIEREALHGVVTGDGRTGPVSISIFADAPITAREAIVEPIMGAACGSSQAGAASRAAVLATDFAAVGALAAIVAAVVFAVTEPPPPGKSTMRAAPLIVATGSGRSQP